VKISTIRDIRKGTSILLISLKYRLKLITEQNSMKKFQKKISGDLDIPGSELDDAQEEIGSEMKK
jgi:hypothetical protein